MPASDKSTCVCISVDKFLSLRSYSIAAQYVVYFQHHAQTDNAAWKHLLKPDHGLKVDSAFNDAGFAWCYATSKEPSSRAA